MVTAKKTSTSAADVAPKSKAVAQKAVAVKTPAAVAVPAAAAPKAAVKKSPAQKATPAKVGATPVAARPAVTAEQRHHYIEVAAFYVAQRRGFAPGNPIDDWAMAEQEVDGLIASGHFPS
ncbi:MAG: DUF2934 domain-containing protein [Rhodoferax sp.]|uniref:DUF2934 domain-containing protein n=1 Tax=Rhodoferax sp. TaxID=50421 RepID=UPI003BB536B3